MAFSEFEAAKYGKTVQEYLDQHKRPPAHIRPELDFGFRISGQSIEIFEIRPAWRGPPGETTEMPCAKTTYVKSKGIWRLFWMRRDLKWHRYNPESEHKTLEDVLAVVEADEFGCFFG